MPDPISTIKAVTDLAGKISPRVVVGIFIAALVLWAVPILRPGLSPWMDSLATEHATALGLTVLLSGVFSGTYASSSGWSAITKRRESRRLAEEKKKAEKDRIGTLHARLSALTLTEKHFLQEYIEGDSRVIQANVTLGRLDALCASGILHLTQMYGVKGTHMISDEAWNYLSTHRELIATPDEPRRQRSFNSEY